MITIMITIYGHIMADLIGATKGVITSARSSTPASSNSTGVGDWGYVRKWQ